MTDYEKSNAILEVEYSRFSHKEYTDLLNCTKNRQVYAQKLIDYLCDKYKIRRIPVKVLNTPRPHSTQRQTYGQYKYLPTSRTGVSITIWNITAKTAKEVAIKTFANTLIHEFIHHYDTEYLQIVSTHTTGFYKRITDLEKKLG
jgi:hypothetical protein